MKRISLLVFSFATVVVANTDMQIIEMCLKKTETTTDEMIKAAQMWAEVKSDSIEQETKQAFTKYGLFIACTLEEESMMVDSKLDIDKMLEAIIEEKPDVNKDEIKKCLTTLNINDKFDRVDRALGLMMCLTPYIKEYLDEKS